MKRLFKVIPFIIVVALISCQSELLNGDGYLQLKSLESNEQKLMRSDEEPFSIHVVYNGKDYYSQCKLLGDSLVVENERLKSMIESLFEENENMQTFVCDGVIEYFDNEEDFYAKYKIEEPSSSSFVCTNIQTKDVDLYNYDGYALVWEDDTYRGWSMAFYDNFGGGSTMDHWDIDKPDNDKISSVEVYVNVGAKMALLQCYEDNGYKGKCLSVSTSVWGVPNRIPDLKKIPRGNKNWGDAISSLKFSIQIPSIIP